MRASHFRRYAACFGIVAVSALVSTTSSAQAPARDPVQAEALYNRGIELLHKDDWAGACERFEASMKLDPAASTQIRIGSCLEHDGKLAQAWYAYQLALKLNPELTQGEQKRQQLADLARARIAAVEPRVPRIKLVVAARPAGLVVKRDGQPVAVLDEPILVDVGDHDIAAEAPGYQLFTTRARAEEGKVAEIKIDLSRVTAPSPAPVLAPDAPASARAPASPSQLAPPPPRTAPPGDAISTAPPAHHPFGRRQPAGALRNMATMTPIHASRTWDSPCPRRACF